jgi:mono/diheme cytochrome c family protein
MSRAGILVVLAACGGGQRAGQADSAALSGAAPPTDTTAMAPDSASHDSAMAVPAPAAAPAPADTSSVAAAPKPRTSKPSAPKRDTTTAAAAGQDTSKKAAAAQDTSKKAAGAKPTASPAAGGGGPTTPQQVALGDSIFHGLVAGGTCTACHGQDAKGTAVAPDLTDSKWINGDGSYQFLVNTITNGVPKPKEHPAPMPPMGGATLTADQVKAVAAYEYSLSHKT